MALQDEVINRYSQEKLAQLTNPDVPNTTVVNLNTLGFAVSDVVGDFDTFCNTTFNINSPRHVSVAVEGVIIKLQIRQLNVDPSDLRKQWEDMLWKLAQIEGRNKIQPQTTSILTPSSEQPLNSTQPVRPLFDPTKFDKFAPQSPPGASNPTSFPTDR